MTSTHDTVYVCVVLLQYSRANVLSNCCESCADEYPESLLSARSGVDVACGNPFVLESPDRQVHVELCEIVHPCL